MLMVNKEGNCIRTANTPAKIEELKQKGFVEVKEEKASTKKQAAKTTEKETDGSVTVTV